jgi:hypothetical protein
MIRNKKGFLFTIGAIFFASTLIFFAQGFYESNLVREREIVSSSIPINMLSLNEDIAFDIADLFGLTFDINSNKSSISIGGKMNSSSFEGSSLSDYNSFLYSVYFVRSIFDKSVSLSNLTDGKAEFYIGDNLNFDYNYGNLIVLFSPLPSSFESFDLNVKTTGSLSSYEWVKTSGGTNFSVNINYSDDSNAVLISDSISNSALSYLKLIYSDGKTSFIEFGKVNYLDTNYNSAFAIKSKPNQLINYNFKADYANSVNLFPVRVNSVLRLYSDNIDSNTLLTLYK